MVCEHEYMNMVPQLSSLLRHCITFCLHASSNAFIPFLTENKTKHFHPYCTKCAILHAKEPWNKDQGFFKKNLAQHLLSHNMHLACSPRAIGAIFFSYWTFIFRIHTNMNNADFTITMLSVLRPRSHGTGSVWSRHLLRSVYGNIYSYHFFYDTLQLSSVILSQI